MPSRERSGEEVSQPIEHSPEPWVVGEYRYDMRNVWGDRGQEVAILGADGKSIVEMNPYGTTGTDEDLKLIAAAPTMYRILRVLIEGRPGLIEADAMSEAHRLIRELEGASDAEG
jgi:hypothetical protein